jgi:hypothetical protein
MLGSIPAPGGSVGLKTLAVYTLGATAGLALYQSVISAYIPDEWENMRVGPLSGQLAFAGLTAIIGAGIASRFVK